MTSPCIFTVPDLAGHGMHQVVAIVDNGFDLSLPAYLGKITGGYTITCDPQPSRRSEPHQQRCAVALGRVDEAETSAVEQDHARRA